MKHFESARTIVAICIYAICLICSMLLFYIWNIRGEFLIHFNIGQLLVLAAIYSTGYFIVLKYFEGFQVGHRRLLDLIFGGVVGALIINFCAALIFGIIFGMHFLELLLTFVGLMLVEILLHLIFVFLCHRIFERDQFEKEAVFVYGPRENFNEYDRIVKTISKYYKKNRSIEYTGDIESVIQSINSLEVVFLGDIPTQQRNQIIKYCISAQISCFGIPKISDIYIQSAYVQQLNDKLLFRYPRTGLDKHRMIVKRLMDIVIGSIMLVCSSPIMLVIAILIKKDDGGPIIYRQDRVTENGKPFHMLKFRSMRVDSEADGIMQTCKDDGRITAVGKRIRNLHFDELPQIINILHGDMSLVGPRPERQEYIDYYAETIPEFPERLKMKGGLTGYAQVYGRYNTQPEDKIKYDLYYMYNYSLMLDIKLLILTVRILTQKENTEGFDDNNTIARS